jgi:hypothetical protein
MEGIVHVHAGEREPVLRITLAIVQDQVALVVIVGDRPWAVGMHILGRGQQIAGAHRTRHRAEPAVIAERPRGHHGEVVGQGADVIDLHRPGRVEIAEVGKIRALAVMQAADQLRDHEIEIGIALAMPMGAHVDRHVLQRDIDIGAVIEVEAAQEILVGLALPAVLGGDQTRHQLEHFADPRSRLLLDLFAGDNSLRRRIRRKKCPVRLCRHAHFRQCHWRRAIGGAPGSGTRVLSLCGGCEFERDDQAGGKAAPRLGSAAPHLPPERKTANANGRRGPGAKLARTPGRLHIGSPGQRARD